MNSVTLDKSHRLVVFKVKPAQVSGRPVKIQIASLPPQISGSVDQGWALESALLTSS